MCRLYSSLYLIRGVDARFRGLDVGKYGSGDLAKSKTVEDPRRGVMSLSRAFSALLHRNSFEAA